jgi:hypothetical protein
VSKNTDRRHTSDIDSTDSDRRNVKRFSSSDMRGAVAQMITLMRIMMCAAALIIADQIYLSTQIHDYVPRAVFFSVLTLMALYQIFRYFGTMRRYQKGESEGGLIATFVEQRNLLVVLTFLLLVTVGVLIVKSF